MALYFVTLSLLILAVLGVRAMFRRTVSSRLIYALWITVVLRLCLPISLFEADFLTILTKQEESTPVEAIHPTEAAEETAASDTSPDEIYPETVLPEMEYIMPEGYMPEVTLPAPVVTNPVPVIPENDVPAETAEIIEEPKPLEETEENVPVDYRYPLRRTAVLVWIGGTAVVALWFTVTGSIFRYRIRRDRKYSGMIGRTKIYVSSSVGAPCLSGLIPEIYITPTVDENPSRELVVLHEYTHLRHLDHLWSFLRIAALCVHWFNPLVWAAAILSKQDAELACDDAICSQLEDEKRFEYARVLIETIPQKHRYTTGLGSSPMKQRILRLTKRQKNHILCAFLAAVLMITAVGCSFVGLRRVTYDNITRQKGFTILSQEQRTVEIQLDMDMLPGYEELCDYSSGAERYPVGITAAEGGNSRIVLKSAMNLVTHEPRTDDRVTLYFDIEHDFSEDEGTILTVHYIQTNGDKNITSVYCWSADDRIATENGDFPDAVMFGDIVPDSGFKVSIPADIYTELDGNVSFHVVMNEIAYARGDEVREYGAEIFTEDEFNELLRKNHREPTAEQTVQDITGEDKPKTESEIQLPPGHFETAKTVRGDIYRCDDVYILDNTPIHGEYTVTFPEGTGDYRIYTCKVVLCDEGCDLTDVVSRAVWGYAPSYRIDQYDVIEAGNGWNYSGRQYYNIVPDEMAAEMRRQMTEGGAEEHEISEGLGERRYIWLLDLGENRYLFTVLEAADYRKDKPENENDIVNGIMKSAVIEVEEYDPDAVFKKQLAEFEAESLWSFR